MKLPARPAIQRIAAAFGARELLRKPKKPPEILYGVEDTPPLAATLLSACQHVGNLSTTLVVPIIIFREAHVPPEVSASIIGISFLGLALAAIIQALPRGPVGSGFLAPSSFAGLYITPSVQAISIGGLPLMFGMTVFSGLMEVCLSRVIRHLRPFLPPEIAGTVTFLLGISGGVVGLRDLLGLQLSGPAPHDLNTGVLPEPLK